MCQSYLKHEKGYLGYLFFILCNLVVQCQLHCNNLSSKRNRTFPVWTFWQIPLAWLPFHFTDRPRQFLQTVSSVRSLLEIKSSPDLLLFLHFLIITIVFSYIIPQSVFWWSWWWLFTLMISKYSSFTIISFIFHSASTFIPTIATTCNAMRCN